MEGSEATMALIGDAETNNDGHAIFRRFPTITCVVS